MARWVGDEGRVTFGYMTWSDRASLLFAAAAIVATLALGTCSTNGRIEDLHRRVDDVHRRIDDLRVEDLHQRVDDVYQQLDDLRAPAATNTEPER